MFGLLKRKKKGLDPGSEMANTDLNNIADAIEQELIELEQGMLFDDIYSHFDNPNGTPRVTYVIFSPSVRREVMARCALSLKRNVDGLGVWSIDWAVKPEYRGKGFGTAVATKAVHEFVNGMMPNRFYLEAVVSINSVASNKIASRLLGYEKTMANFKTQEVINHYLVKI